MSRRAARSVWWKWAATAAILFIVGTSIGAYVLLNTLDFNSVNSAIVSAVKEATGRDLALGQLDLQIGFTPVLIAENLSFRNPKWAHRLDLARIRRLEIYVDLIPLFSQKMVIKRLVLVEPDIQLEIARSGLSNFNFTQSNKKDNNRISSPKPTKLPQFTFREILLKNVKLSLKRAASRKPIAVWLESVEVTTKGPDAPIQLKLKGIFGRKAFKVQALTGSLEELLTQNKPWPLEATIQALGAHYSVRGSISDLIRIKGLNFTLKAEGPGTKEIGDLLNVEYIPDIGAFRLAAMVSIPELGVYNISHLRLHINETEISSRFQLCKGEKRPKINGILYCQDMDLRPFLRGVESDSQKEPRRMFFSNKPMKTDMLAALDGEFKIRARKIITPYGLMENVQMDALLKDLRLTMRRLKATIGGGGAEVQGICRAEGNSLAVSGRIKIDELELNRLLKDIHSDEVVDGAVGGEVEFSTFGNSVRSLMANLNGKAVVSVGRGRIKSRIVKPLGADLSTGLLALFGPSESKGDYTAVNCAVCGLDVKEGVVRVTALVVDTPETSVRGAGEVDLRTERLDLSLDPLPKRGVAGLSLSLGELAKPFKLGGTFADPTLSVDPTRTALTIGKAVAGLFLFGPLGLAGVLAGMTSDPNPCASALEAARKVAKPLEAGGVGDSATHRDLLKRDAQGGH